MILHVSDSLSRTAGRPAVKLSKNFYTNVRLKISVGERFYKLPFDTLSCVQLAEVFAYCLIQYGRSDAKTNLVLNELNARQEKIDDITTELVLDEIKNKMNAEEEYDDEEYDELYRGDRW